MNVAATAMGTDQLGGQSCSRTDECAALTDARQDRTLLILIKSACEPVAAENTQTRRSRATVDTDASFGPWGDGGESLGRTVSTARKEISVSRLPRLRVAGRWKD